MFKRFVDTDMIRKRWYRDHASDVYKMLTSFLWCYMCPGPNVDNIKAFTPGERIGGFAGELSALREKYGKGGL